MQLNREGLETKDSSRRAGTILKNERSEGGLLPVLEPDDPDCAAIDAFYAAEDALAREQKPASKPHRPIGWNRKPNSRRWSPG